MKRDGKANCNRWISSALSIGYLMKNTLRARHHGERWVVAKVLVLSPTPSHETVMLITTEHDMTAPMLFDNWERTSCGRAPRSRILPMLRFLHSLALCVAIWVGSFLPALAQNAS